VTVPPSTSFLEWLRASCAASGVPLHVEDETVLRRAAALITGTAPASRANAPVADAPAGPEPAVAETPPPVSRRYKPRVAAALFAPVVVCSTRFGAAR
jgi:hypothetical protein